MTPDEKHRFGQIAADYPASPEGLRAVVDDPRFRAMFPNARVVGSSIDFGAGEMVDVLRVRLEMMRARALRLIDVTARPSRCSFCGTPDVTDGTNCRNCGAPA